MKNKGLLLIEIGTEELPFLKLNNIGSLFLKKFVILLKNNFFNFYKSKYYITCRRISILIYDLSFYQKKKNSCKKIFGPFFELSKINYKLLNKWCKKKKINKSLVLYKEKGGVRYYYFNKKIKNFNLFYFLKNFIEDSLFYLSKKYKFVRWCNNNFFIRPINNFLLLYKNKLVDLSIFGVKSSNKIIVNRSIGNNKIFVNKAEDYYNLLYDEAKVILSYEKRKLKVIKFLDIFNKKKRINFVYDGFFLDKIVSIVEWPFCVLASIDEKFLCLPKKILFNVFFKYNCFPSLNNNVCRGVSVYFVIVLDLFVGGDIVEDIKIKYIKNIECYLNYLLYLINKDSEINFINYFPKLNSVIFHEKLGTLLDKVSRMLILSFFLIKLCDISLNINILFYSLILCKCDLVTFLFKEFTDLKGYIGKYYSLKSNFSKEISFVLEKYYNPNNFKDEIYYNVYCNVLSLCDKLDNLISILLIDSGLFLKKNNDPYFLRRTSFCIIKIIVLNNINMNIYKFIKYLLSLYKIKYDICVLNIIKDFIFKRFLDYLKKCGYERKIILSLNSCKNKSFLNINGLYKKIIYVKFIKDKYLNKFNKIVILHKRLKNFLNKKFNNFILNENKHLYNDKILIKYVYFLKLNFKIYNLNLDYPNIFRLLLDCYYIVNNYLYNNRINVEDIEVKFKRIFLLNEIYVLLNKFIDFTYFY